MEINWLGCDRCFSFSDSSPSSYSKNSSPSVSTPKTQNVYRGTKIAKQEFYKYSRSERLRIQKYLKDNFGYRSTIDGLWGPKTASSFIRAANRHVIGKSLYSPGNVTKVFGVALQKQKTAPITSAPVRKSTQKQNNFGLVGQQLNTFNYFKALCLAGVGQNLGICMQNAMCQAQTGRPCQQNIPQKSLHCFIHKGAFPMLPDTVICN